MSTICSGEDSDGDSPCPPLPPVLTYVEIAAPLPPPPPPPARKRSRKRAAKHKNAALREIKKYQQSAALLLRRAPFARLVREIEQDLNPRFYRDGPSRFAPTAFTALQEAAEMYAVYMLSDAALCAAHAKRETLMQSDIRLARTIRREGTHYSIL